MNSVSRHDMHQHSVSISSVLKPILAKPLIVGASISGNHRGVASPGRQLALRATPSSAIRTIAKSGRPAKVVLRSIKEEDLRDRTCVIGIDLLFWDSTLPNLGETLEAFDHFKKQVKHFNLPIALGEVPGFFPSMQPHWKQINHEIRNFAKDYSHCVVLPFDSIYHQIIQDGALVHHGVRYSVGELIPDGLHLSTLAGLVLADRLQDEWVKKLME